MTPAFGAYVRPYTHPHPPAPFVAPRAPRPSSAPRNRKVIPPETEPRGCYTNQTAENEVKPKVTKVCKARATHVDGSADRNEDENERVNRRGGGLVAVGDDSIIRVGGTGEVRVFCIEWEELGPSFEVGACGCREVIGVCAKRSGGEEGDGYGKFGGEEERQIKEAGPGEARMAAGEGFETVLKDVLVGVCAYARGHQYPVVVVRTVELVDGEIVDTANVRTAA